MNKIDEIIESIVKKEHESMERHKELYDCFCDTRILDLTNVSKRKYTANEAFVISTALECIHNNVSFTFSLIPFEKVNSTHERKTVINYKGPTKYVGDKEKAYATVLTLLGELETAWMIKHLENVRI